MWSFIRPRRFTRPSVSLITTSTISTSSFRQAPKMATPYDMHLIPENTGLWKPHQDAAAAKKASELLQQDLRDHHCFFNQDGFHNHISHHILALYGTGATPEQMQKGYDDNTSYQRQAAKPHDRIPEELKNWEHAKKYLGKEQYYTDFLVFFQKEMETKGWEEVLQEYVFKGDEAADDLFGRLFAGFLHPLIQLMYGVEWSQPAIVAEALAQTCVHNALLNPFLFEAEKLANSKTTGPMPSIVSLYEQVRADDTLRNSPHMSDGNKVRDGVLVRAKEQILSIAARVKISPEELDERTAEMFNAAVYVASSAALQFPKKHLKYDFFLMHHVNSAPIFLTINSLPWVSTETKVRLLEFKIRMDLLEYAARGSPPLSADKIKAYKPKPKEQASTPMDLVTRLHRLDDDGHGIKLARATGICQQISGKYADREGMFVKGDDWLQVFHMIVDSLEGPGSNWVRTTGLEEAWKDVADAPKL